MVLPAGAHAEDAVESLSSERMKSVVQHLRSDNDVVVFDTPPTLVVVDPVVLARYADGVVFVVDSRRTSRRDARRAVEALRGDRRADARLRLQPLEHETDQLRLLQAARHGPADVPHQGDRSLNRPTLAVPDLGLAIAVSATGIATGLVLVEAMNRFGAVGAIVPAVLALGLVLLRYPAAALTLLVATTILVESESQGFLPPAGVFYDVVAVKLTPQDMLLFAGLGGVLLRFVTESERPRFPEPLTAPLLLLGGGRPHRRDRRPLLAHGQRRRTLPPLAHLGLHHPHPAAGGERGARHARAQALPRDRRRTRLLQGNIGHLHGVQRDRLRRRIGDDQLPQPGTEPDHADLRPRGRRGAGPARQGAGLDARRSADRLPRPRRLLPPLLLDRRRPHPDRRDHHRQPPSWPRRSRDRCRRAGAGAWPGLSPSAPPRIRRRARSSSAPRP